MPTKARRSRSEDKITDLEKHEHLNFLSSINRAEISTLDHFDVFMRLITVLNDVLNGGKKIEFLSSLALDDANVNRTTVINGMYDKWSRYNNRREVAPLSHVLACVSSIYKQNLISSACNVLNSSVASSPEPPSSRLFYSLQYLLGISSDTINKAPDLLAGHYQYWRYSNSMSGCLIKGLYSIEKRDNNVLGIDVEQIYNPHAFPLNAEHVDASDETHLMVKTERLTGIVLRMAGDSRIFSQFWDTQKRLIRINIFNRISYEETSPGTRRVKDMSGVIVGVDDSFTFVSPIYVERIDHSKLSDFKKTLNTYPIESAPLRVRRNLQLIGKRIILTE